MLSEAYFIVSGRERRKMRSEMVRLRRRMSVGFALRQKVQNARLLEGNRIRKVRM